MHKFLALEELFSTRPELAEKITFIQALQHCQWYQQYRVVPASGSDSDSVSACAVLPVTSGAGLRWAGIAAAPLPSRLILNPNPNLNLKSLPPLLLL